MFAGFLGMIVGTIILPPLGGMIGLFAAVLMAEYYNHKNQARAFKAALGSFMGMLAGKIVNAVMALGFVILFVIFAL